MNHITVEEDASPTDEDGCEAAPPELEDGGQATVDELKEINLGTAEDPCAHLRQCISITRGRKSLHCTLAGVQRCVRLDISRKVHPLPL